MFIYLKASRPIDALNVAVDDEVIIDTAQAARGEPPICRMAEFGADAIDALIENEDALRLVRLKDDAGNAVTDPGSVRSLLERASAVLRPAAGAS